MPNQFRGRCTLTACNMEADHVCMRAGQKVNRYQLRLAASGEVLCLSFNPELRRNLSVITHRYRASRNTVETSKLAACGVLLMVGLVRKILAA